MLTIPDTHRRTAEAVAIRRSLTRVAHFSRALPTELLERLWSSPGSLMDTGDTLRRSDKRWTVKLTWDSQSYVLKHHSPKWGQAVRQLITPSTGWKTWSFTQKLIEAGVRTPPPLACVENRWGPLCRDSFFMYPYVEGRILISYFGAPEEKNHPFIAGLWRQLEEFWQRLASLRAYMEDPNLNNFVVSPTGELWVIDLDKSCFHRSHAVTQRRLEQGWQKLIRGVVI